MINEHIWDLMQRDLDDDLSPEEQLFLRSSVQKDPDLQLMYERLKRVSDQLEQLPPVTPAFSIVDSILPQLEEAALQPSTAPASTRTELPRLELKSSASQAKRPKWKGLPVWMARAGSGLVAACLLFGLFFMVNGPKQSGPDVNNQGSTVTPTSNPTPSVIVPPLPEKKRTNLSPSSKETTKPPVATDNTRKNNEGKTKTKKQTTKPTTPSKPKPIKSKPAVTVQPVEESKPSFPFGTEIKPGKDDKPDKDEKKSDDRDHNKGNDSDKKDDEKDKDRKKKRN
jgi:hypothetical protein